MALADRALAVSEVPRWGQAIDEIANLDWRGSVC